MQPGPCGITIPKALVVQQLHELLTYRRKEDVFDLVPEPCGSTTERGTLLPQLASDTTSLLCQAFAHCSFFLEQLSPVLP